MAWQDGAFDLLVSPLLIAELERALAYPNLRRRIPQDDAARVVAWLANTAELAPDPDVAAPVRSPDPDDDYLLALAAANEAIVVSGDGHLLSLGDGLPIHSPADFLEFLATRTEDV